MTLYFANQASLGESSDDDFIATVSEIADAVILDLTGANSLYGPEAVILDLLSFRTMEGDVVVNPFWDTGAAQLLITRTWEAGLLMREVLNLMVRRIDRDELPMAHVEIARLLEKTQ